MSDYSSGGDAVVRPRARRNWRDALPFVIGAILILLGVFFGFVATNMVRDKSNIGDAFGKTISNIPLIPYFPPPAEVFGKDRIYILMLGIDYNYDDKGMPYSKGARSDTIMVAGVDFPTKSLKLVSVLRDSEAMVHGRDVKINEAYSDGGEPLSDAVIGDFLGMPTVGSTDPTSAGNVSPASADPNAQHFDRYVIVKINAIKDFVNAIGGIDVPVTEQMDYDDSWGHLHIHFKPGLVHMNGEDAQGYMRFRHDACSDPCRTKRQQQVIHLAIEKLKGQKFNSLTHIASLIQVMNKDVITNLSTREITSLAWSFRDANAADLGHADTIGYVDTKQTAYDGEVVIPDQAQKAKLVAALLGPYEKVSTATPPPAKLAAVKPSTVHITVENGSGISGMAAAAAAKFKTQGYIVDGIANADSSSYAVSEIRPATVVPLVGERVKTDLGVPGATITPATDATPGPKRNVTVIIGKDFAEAQAAPAPSGAASAGASAKPTAAP